VVGSLEPELAAIFFAILLQIAISKTLGDLSVATSLKRNKSHH